MLGKLIKHEWKGTWRVGGMMLCILAAMTALGLLTIFSVTSVAKADHVSDAVAATVSLTAMLVLMVYMIGMASVSIGIYVYEGVRFYKTMYSAEGYLTHTLPAKKSEILLSKILIGGVWVILISLGMFASVMTLVSLGIPDVNVLKLLKQFFENYGLISQAIQTYLGLNMTLYLCIIIVFLILAPFIGLIILFGCISIGQLFSGARVLMAIVTYFGVILLTNILRSALSVVWNMGLISSTSIQNYSSENFVASVFYGQLLLMMGIQIVTAVLMYFASWKITSSKLNLQ